MSQKSWTDQPDVVATMPVAFSVFVESIGQSVEVRKGSAGEFTVTIGNLFGSQTILAPDVNSLLLLLGRTFGSKRGQTHTLPEGCELLDSPKPEERVA